MFIQKSEKKRGRVNMEFCGAMHDSYSEVKEFFSIYEAWAGSEPTTFQIGLIGCL